MASPAATSAPEPARESTVAYHRAGYARVMNDVARSGLLTPDLLGVYTVIAGYAGGNGECWQQQAILASHIKISVRTFQRHLKKLIELGFISERVRRHGLKHGEERGRSLYLSDEWRWPSQASDLTPDSAPPGRVTRQIRSDSHDKSDASHTTDLTPLKRTRLKAPEKTPPTVLRTSGGVGADAPAPRAENGPREEKRSGPKRAPTAPRASTLTPAPDEIELTPGLLKLGAENGYDEARVRELMHACLDHFGAKGERRADWVRTLQQWIRNQRRFDDRDARQQAGLVGGRRPGAGPRRAETGSYLAGITDPVMLADLERNEQRAAARRAQGRV